MSSLFIGGAAAGEHIDVPDACVTWRVPDDSRTTVAFHAASDMSEPTAIHWQQYKEHLFSTPNRRHRFFAPEEWSADDAFEELVRGYKP